MAYNIIKDEALTEILKKSKVGLATKVDKQTGYGLSKNDYTDEEKKKLADTAKKVQDLETTGAQPNVIETVKVNGTALVPDAQKAVDISVPTTEQIKTQIEAYEYQTESQVSSAITKALAAQEAKRYVKFESFADLPVTGEDGVIYLIPHAKGDNDAYDEYFWNSTDNKYEKYGNTDIDLSGYQIKITGAATTILTENLTANRALISNADGKVAVSDVTDAELGYLKDVTSNVQAQLNDKAPTDHTHSIGITGGATATAVKAGTAVVNLNVTSVSTSVLSVPSGDALVLDGNF